MKVKSGVSMQLDRARIHFVRARGRPFARACLADRVPEIRKLLHSDLSFIDIAKLLGVRPPTLRGFIKRRNLCNLRDRTFLLRKIKLGKLLDGY